MQQVITDSRDELIQEVENEEELIHSNKNRNQVTAMVSNFSTSYNAVNVSMVLPILNALEKGNDSASEHTSPSVLASSLLAGMILGQLVGGTLGDSSLGVARSLQLVLAVQIVASLSSALFPSSDSLDFYGQLAAWRFFLGVGAGGVYPLAAQLSAAQRPSMERRRHTAENPVTTFDAESTRRVVLTFIMQGAGFWMVPFLALLFLEGSSSKEALEVTWKLLLGLGSIPGIVMLSLLWWDDHKFHQHNMIVDSPDNIVSVVPSDGIDSDGEGESVLDSIAADIDQHRDVLGVEEDDLMIATHEDSDDPTGLWAAIRHEPDLHRKLLGTAATWFLFDVLFYGNTLFAPIVLQATFGYETKDPMQSLNDLHLLRKTATESLILTSIAIPGYIVAGVLIGRPFCNVDQSPRYVMLQGFAMMSVLYFILGVFWGKLRHTHPIFILVLYGSTFFFANYGPNTTTFVLPSLVYSERCRSTLNGISAAAGKVGAAMGAWMFEPAANRWGDGTVMIICAVISAFAFLLTQTFVPSQRQQDPELSVVESEDIDEVAPPSSPLPDCSGLKEC